MKIFKLILGLILAVITWLLRPILETITFILVVVKYGFKDSQGYFLNSAYNFDVYAASQYRTLWNHWLIIPNGYQFTKDTDKSISRYLGINHKLKQLTWFGMFWFKILGKKHCYDAMKYEDNLIFKK